MELMGVDNESIYNTAHIQNPLRISPMYVCEIWKRFGKIMIV